MQGVTRGDIIMHRKGLRLLAILFTAVLLWGSIAGSARANSAPTYWWGVDSTGVMITGKESPIEVEKEVLTFDIQQFPESWYDTQEEYLSYSGNVTASYTFYNPSDYTVTARLLFPFGCEPAYAPDHGEDDDTDIGKDTAEYGVSIDGKGTEATIRHSLSTGDDVFSLESDLARIRDGYVRDAFYSPDLSVTEYTFRADGVDTETYHAASVAFDMTRYDEQRRVCFAQQSGYALQNDGTVRVSDWVENDKLYTVYVIGEAFESFPDWTFYRDGVTKNGDEIDGTMTLVSEEKLRLEELALSGWTKASGVSKIDWYNAFVDHLNQPEGEPESVIYMGEDALDLSHFLMRWYEYEITLEPGARIENEVTAPMYPTINKNYDPAIYEYTYLLSPAKAWKKFGDLEVVLNTPYYMTECSLEGFSKTQSGYTGSFSGLPDQELEFTLSSSETPQAVKENSPAIYSVVFIGFVLVGTGIVVVVVLSRRKKQIDQSQEK